MRTVLITGGTGYFGQAMVRRLLEADMSERICIYSRDEVKQATMRAALPDPNKRLRFFIGDVRDKDRLTHAMAGIDTVIHAAALKRVEVGEYNPGEMVKTNVLGTMNLIEAATITRQGGQFLKRVIALSTDKACQPVNAYGASKLMLEKLVLGANNARGMNGPIFAVTRYGNVANSTGSVISNWRAALRNPPLMARPTITVTNERATRFWMTIDQAIDLVLETAAVMRGGELVIPDLPAYDLGTLMKAMGITSDKVIIRYQGLGPGEKLHERMKEDGPDSSQVHRMSEAELREALKHV